jgi:hypothetical protein
MKQYHSSIVERSSFFAFLVMSFLLTLVVGSGGISWLTGRQVSDIAGLLMTWLFVTLALSVAVTVLSRRVDAWMWASLTKETAAPAEEEPSATHDLPPDPPGPDPAAPPDPGMLLRYLALRATLQWHYRADPYRAGDGEVADHYRPAELVLSRHAYEKLVAWAERNSVSLSDAAERMILNGMADEHLAHIVRQEGWADSWSEAGE